jgi:hypothetical protein
MKLFIFISTYLSLPLAMSCHSVDLLGPAKDICSEKDSRFGWKIRRFFCWTLHLHLNLVV